MDYLQTLEFQMAALQRKLRLLQDLRFFVETAQPEELARFGDELRAVTTSSGASVGAVVAALLGAPGPAVAGQPAAVPAFAAGAPPPRNVASPAPGRPPSAAPGPSSAPGAVPVAPAAASPVAQEAAPAPRGGEGGAGEAGGGEKEELLGLIRPCLKAIAAGSFVMGSETGDGSEKPPHKVNLGSFSICDHLATNREFSLFLRANPEWGKDRAEEGLRDGSYLSDWEGDNFPEGKEDHPVAFVSWHAASAFASWLGLRLPTEAEWERAARGGLVGKKFPNGDLMNDKLANLAKQYRGTTPVRQFEPNGFGLYDMAGNLFEWTADWYGPYAAGEAVDPRGAAENDYKVVRGGSWMSGAGALRVSARVDMEPASCGQTGIRLAL